MRRKTTIKPALNVLSRQFRPDGHYQVRYYMLVMPVIFIYRHFLDIYPTIFYTFIYNYFFFIYIICSCVGLVRHLIEVCLVDPLYSYCNSPSLCNMCISPAPSPPRTPPTPHPQFSEIATYILVVDGPSLSPPYSIPPRSPLHRCRSQWCQYSI